MSVKEFKITKSVFGQMTKLAEEKLPTKATYTITFQLLDVNAAIAIAIRRTLLDEMLVKSLYVDLKDIDTNEPFIKLDEFRDRIKAIPLDQNIKPGSYKIDVVNNNLEIERSIVHSSDIIGLAGAARKTWRLAELHASRYLHVDNIYIREGYGYEDSAAFSLTSAVHFRCIDHMSITEVNERGHFVSKMVKLSDLVDLFKKMKVKVPAGRLVDKRIMFIPNKNHQHLLSERQLAQLKTYDVVLESTTAGKTAIKKAYSAASAPKNYELKVESLGTMEPVALMKKCCQNIKARLAKIKADLDKTQDIISVIQKGERSDAGSATSILIRGETHTIGNLLRQTIFDLDPAIANVRTSLEHPSNRAIILILQHPQPIKITKDAIDKCTAVFDKIEGQFKKIEGNL